MQRVFTLIAVGILIFTFPLEAGAEVKEKGFFFGRRDWLCLGKF